MRNLSNPNTFLFLTPKGNSNYQKFYNFNYFKKINKKSKFKQCFSFNQSHDMSSSHLGEFQRFPPPPKLPNFYFIKTGWLIFSNKGLIWSTIRIWPNLSKLISILKRPPPPLIKKIPSHLCSWLTTEVICSDWLGWQKVYVLLMDRLDVKKWQLNWFCQSS